jgi:hypothetical protein
MFGQGEIASLVAAVLKLASNHIRRRCWRPENRQAQRLSLSTVNFAKLRFSTCRAWQNSPDGSLNCSHRHGYLQELSIRKNTLEKVDGVRCMCYTLARCDFSSILRPQLPTNLFAESS